MVIGKIGVVGAGAMGAGILLNARGQSLIDAADKPVARRVMKAADYLPPSSNLTSFPAKAEIPVRMWIDARGLGASGYRLYIFYP